MCGPGGSESYGRIVFRKPPKRSSDDGNSVLSASSTTKKAKTDVNKAAADGDTRRTEGTADKAKVNSSLLSFDDDEDNDDD